MKKINKMLFRELLKTKMQFLTAAAVIFLGIVIFSASIMSYLNLKASVDYSYENYKFLDYYAETNGLVLTAQAVEQVKTLKGVRAAVGRISADASIAVDPDTRIQVKIISLPYTGRPEINDLCVLSGTYPDPAADNSCMLSSRFGNYYSLKAGSTLKVDINFKTYNYKVGGLVSGPEFLKLMKSYDYYAQSDGDFGLVFINEAQLNHILGGKGYNQLHVLFDRNINAARVDQLVKKIEDIIKPYGIVTSCKRAQQLSNIMISDELDKLKLLVLMLPLVFLLVAALIIYIMQRRMISSQHVLIGTMKAMGYGDKKILRHYMILSLILSLTGAIPAIGAGQLLGMLMTKAYLQVYDIPELYIRIYPLTFLIAIILSIIFCTSAGYNAAKTVLKMEPARAIRPEAPEAACKIYRRRLFSRHKKLPSNWNICIRNILRNPGRSFLTTAGYAVTVIILIVMLFLPDTAGYFINLQYSQTQKQDYTVMFYKPLPLEDIHGFAKTEGIKKIEPIIQVPVEIGKGDDKIEARMTGIDRKATLYNLTDKAGEKIAVPEKGVLIATSLAKKLSVKPGDKLSVKYYLSYGQIKEKTLTISGIVSQAVGMDAYMNLDEIAEQAGIPRLANGMLITLSGGESGRAEKLLYGNSSVKTVESRMSALAALNALMYIMYAFVGFMVVFSIIMGFAIVFNSTIINITERRRELATLKAMGYTDSEIGRMVFRENIILGILAFLPGIPIGRIIAELYAPMLNSRMMVLEAVVYPRTYIFACICVFIYIILAQPAIQKSIKSIAIVEVLKDREG